MISYCSILDSILFSPTSSIPFFSHTKF
jgi:hypothetical protein